MMWPGWLTGRCSIYADGGTVDDLLVYKYDSYKYLLLINAANIEKDWNWVMENAEGFAVKLTNSSEEIAQLALQGPLAEQILAKSNTTGLCLR